VKRLIKILGAVLTATLLSAGVAAAASLTDYALYLTT
jgi:hypothetical protein